MPETHHKRQQLTIHVSPSFRWLENAHILLWLIKDFCWAMEWKTGGVIMIFPTVSVGDVLTYTVTLTNTGGIALPNVVVNDVLTTPGSVTCASVAPGSTCQLVGTYTVTQADANAGNIRNTCLLYTSRCV